MTKSLDEWIRWATIIWHGKSFVNFSRKLGFAPTVYCIWQERNARTFVEIRFGILCIEFENIWRSFGLGFNPGT